MESSNQAPNLFDNGVSGTQQAGIVEDIGDSAVPPLTGQYIERAMIGLAAARPGKFGGDLGAPMFTAMVNHFSHEKEQAKSSATAAQAKLEAVAAELNALKLEKVKLDERLDNLRSTSRIKQTSAFLSPVLFSVAIDLYKGNMNLSVVIAIAAAALLAVNFFGFQGKSK
ncbi:hypothetical protein MHB_0027110 [Pseudomonas fluorescens BBc6R8]|uniref:hypothetical protein n=1 Tax=Pseudomonas fluorescens TaxID=294 RepID=UPI000281C8F8|nr:hypothetical protein [Pseudomonas fluorescens]QQD53759.1 hypothetical protein MHB_0027110 [Pseudomonas fluorescens BBc6R8]